MYKMRNERGFLKKGIAIELYSNYQVMSVEDI